MNAQLIVHARSKRSIVRTNALHGTQTFSERSQQRVNVRAFARSNVKLIAETFCVRLRNDLEIRRSIGLYSRKLGVHKRSRTFTNVYKRPIDRTIACLCTSTVQLYGQLIG
jgi:hypothetical protein